MNAEVIVVGAGPAGSATALLLARAGRDVLLLDRSEFPRAKACGECLSAGATPLLSRLGVLDALADARPARLEGWRIHAPGGAVAESPASAAPSYSITREVLDHLLLRCAHDAGARVRTGSRVVELERDASGTVTGVETDAGRHRARLVIGADGLRSTVARRAGLVARRPRLRKLSFTAHMRGLAHADERGELHLAHGASLGIAPVEQRNGAGRLFNVTLVLRGGSGVSAAAALERMRDFPGMSRRLARAELVPALGKELLTSGPFDWPMRAAARPGLALVGDAAGYFDPFTGQGVFHALRGAELLAHAAERALAYPGVIYLRGYARELRRRMREAHALQRAVELIVSQPAFADRAVSRLQRAPAPARAFFAAIAGTDAPRVLLSPALLISFLVPSAERIPHA